MIYCSIISQMNYNLINIRILNTQAHTAIQPKPESLQSTPHKFSLFFSFNPPSCYFYSSFFSISFLLKRLPYKFMYTFLVGLSVIRMVYRIKTLFVRYVAHSKWFLSKPFAFFFQSLKPEYLFIYQKLSSIEC